MGWPELLQSVNRLLAGFIDLKYQVEVCHIQGLFGLLAQSTERHLPIFVVKVFHSSDQNSQSG